MLQIVKIILTALLISVTLTSQALTQTFNTYDPTEIRKYLRSRHEIIETKIHAGRYYYPPQGKITTEWITTYLHVVVDDLNKIGKKFKNFEYRVVVSNYNPSEGNVEFATLVQFKNAPDTMMEITTFFDNTNIIVAKRFVSKPYEESLKTTEKILLGFYTNPG